MEQPPRHPEGSDSQPPQEHGAGTPEVEPDRARQIIEEGRERAEDVEASALGEPPDDEADPGAQARSSAPPDRLTDLEERLAPLPDLGDIPRPAWGHAFDSGWDWMGEGLPAGWHPEPAWGRDGWDLGAWPLVVVALFVDDRHERYAVATYVEGDIEVRRYQSRDALHVAVNEIAEFHWRLGQSHGPSDLPEGQGLLAKHAGPYDPRRREREMAADEALRRQREAGNSE